MYVYKYVCIYIFMYIGISMSRILCASIWRLAPRLSESVMDFPRALFPDVLPCELSAMATGRAVDKY